MVGSALVNKNEEMSGRSVEIGNNLVPHKRSSGAEDRTEEPATLFYACTWSYPRDAQNAKENNGASHGCCRDTLAH